jgi:hypothetical protein
MRSRRKHKPAMDVTFDDLDIDADLAIDKFNLEDECLRQASLYMKYVKLSADAAKQRSYAEERVKTIRSSLIKQIKKEKPSLTAQLIESEYRLDPKYKAAKKALIQAEWDDAIFYGAIFAFQQRKSKLEDLIQLWSQGYFSAPNTDRYPKHRAIDEMKRTEKIRRRTQPRS